MGCCTGKASGQRGTQRVRHLGKAHRMLHRKRSAVLPPTTTYLTPFAIGQYESALLTLNSCPMFTYNERDLHRMPTPARTHLPIREFIKESGILDEDSARDNEVCGFSTTILSPWVNFHRRILRCSDYQRHRYEEPLPRHTGC